MDIALIPAQSDGQNGASGLGVDDWVTAGIVMGTGIVLAGAAA